MATLLALVETGGEALVALRSGAERAAVVVRGSGFSDVIGDDGTARPGWIVWPVSGDEPLSLARRAIAARVAVLWLSLTPDWEKAIQLARRAGVTVIGLVLPEQQLEAGLCAKALHLGCRGLLVAEEPFSGRRMLDHRSVADLSAFARLCGDQRLAVAFSGGVEPPDVPRLLALAPDEIGFDLALRNAAGQLDPLAVRAAQVLLANGPSSSKAAVIQAAGTDRIFVRDWIVSMSIGAYARERGTPQRVRFTVEASLRRSDARGGMAAVVSYDLITDAIASLSATHIDLVEELAESLAESILAHPRVIEVDITVEKLDIGPGTVGCRIARKRADGRRRALPPGSARDLPRRS